MWNKIIIIIPTTSISVLLLLCCLCLHAFPRHHQLPSGSMKILQTKVSDSGIYVCVASNIAGNLTQSVLLSVLGEFSVGKSASPASVQALFLSKSGPLLPCSTFKYSAWPQGDEGTSGSSS